MQLTTQLVVKEITKISNSQFISFKSVKVTAVLLLLSFLAACADSGSGSGANAQDQSGNNNPDLTSLDDDSAELTIDTAFWDADTQVLSVAGDYSPGDLDADEIPDSIAITDVDMSSVNLAKISIDATDGDVNWSTDISSMTIAPCQIKATAGDASHMLVVENAGSNCGGSPATNMQPVAVISPATDQAITVGTSINFIGDTSTDADNNTPLTYQWTFTDSTSATTTSTAANPTVLYDLTGTHTASLIVTDTLGLASMPTTITIVVTAIAGNQAPSAVIITTPLPDSSGTINRTTANGNNVVTFAGNTSSDPDGNTPLTYNWVFAGGTPATSTVALPGNVSYSTAGNYQATLIVTDSLGLASTMASVTITVVDPAANVAPNAVITSTPAADITSGDINITTATGNNSVTFSGNTSNDPDGNTPLTYAWAFAGGTPATATTVTPGNVSYAAAGTFQTTLTVTDSLGLASTITTVNVVVVDPTVNSPPTAVISATPTADTFGNININTGANINFSANTSSDPEDDIPLTYAWIFAGGTPTSNTTVSPGNILFSTAGTYLVSLAVTDSLGNVDPLPTQVTVIVTDLVNLPPDGSITHDNGDGTVGSSGDINIVAGMPIVFNGSAIDPEGNAVTYAWNFNGATASATTGSGPISVIFSTPGAIQVSLTATDINGSSDPTPAVLTVNVSLPAFQFLPVLTDEDGNPNDALATYTLNVEENVNVNVVTPFGNWTTPMMRYNGLQLPPVIVAKRGTQMTFNVNNNLLEDTTVHWHGFKIPAIQDGGPNFPILAATPRTYNFTIVQPAAPLWFHPHAHGNTATQVYNGLAGAFIVTDDVTANLETTKQIPAGNQDIALLLQDRSFAADDGTGTRALVYQAQAPGAMAGMLGDHVLVNGVELPGLKVDTRQYRFRVFNGSNARTYDIALSDGAMFSVVGTDGGLLNTPVQTNHIMLSAGERAEIVVDFAAYTVGTNVMLVSQTFNTGGMMGGGALANGTAFDIMRFEVTTQVVDDVVMYSSLPTTADINTRLTALDATATRSFVMSMAMGQFRINGLVFDINRIDEIVASGATEIWDISNTSPMPHPFHAHAIQWQILDRNGVPATGVDLGWKDTVLVLPNESVRFIGRFDPVINKGVYMYHCHILEHEEAGMMGTFEVQ